VTDQNPDVPVGGPPDHADPDAPEKTAETPDGDVQVNPDPPAPSTPDQDPNQSTPGQEGESAPT
jgi:hypothetical protein